MTTAPTTRLAPTPSGYIHAGNAVNFILNAAFARVQEGGRVLLRIDDIDADRKRPEYVEDIFRTLDWLGIGWDIGPSGPDDFERNWSQHLRLEGYHAFLGALAQKNAVFPCQLSRKALAELGGQYPAHLRHQGIGLDAPDTAWRADTPPHLPLQYFVVRRRDGLPAYQVASVCDDLQFGITTVYRGHDLQASTRAQQWLAEVAGHTAFGHIDFRHHALLEGPDGLKLSKSAGAGSVRYWGDGATTKRQLFQTAAKWLGATDENIGEMADLVAFFRDYKVF
jgi:glutamyl-tRNA synthetase